ncbi:MAG TPA: CHAT domain-containing tetratricopeptide repeat protein [Blastocatellia bacterium]|nr:CHAT domain-containing tetratricopeptide repeat protein [Blastocatellia bacterium]
MAQSFLPRVEANFGSQTQGNKDAAVLELGKPVERELAGGEIQVFRIQLTANQYVKLVAEQKGIDVIVSLFGPEGEKIVEVDSPNGTQGPEPVTLIAIASGSYRLEVSSPDKSAKSGRYEVKIADLRNATEQDKRREAARQIFADAEQLRAQGTAASLRKAIEKYAEALPRWREASDQAGEANTLNNLAVAHHLLGETKKAVDYLSQALSLTRAVGDRAGEGETLGNIGYMYATLGEKQKALESYNLSLPILRVTGNRLGEAATLNNIGMVYDSVGEKQKALDYYGQVLPLARALGERAGEASTLSNIGKVHRDLGDNQKALEYYNQTLELQRRIGDRRGQGLTLNNIASAHDEMGEPQVALDNYAESLQLLRAAGDRATEALTLANLGSVYSELEDNQKALDYYNQALPVLRDVGDRHGEAVALGNIGKVFASQGERQKALDYYDRALPLARSVGDRALEGRLLNNIGGLQADSNERQKALETFDQALALFRAVGDRREEANTLSNIGGVYADLNENQKALDTLNRALPLRRAVRDRNREAITLYQIARVERDKGNLLEARNQIEAALKIVESLRTKIASEELRASYFASAQKYYGFYIDLLMRLHDLNRSGGFDAAALEASEKARARSLLDLLTEANADIRQGVDPKLLDRERSLQQLLSAKAERQIRLLGGKHTEEQAAAAAREVQALTIEYAELEGQIKATGPRYAALTQPQPLSVRAVQQQVLDSDTMLLEYALGDERSFLWAVTQTSLASYELPKRADIEALARRFYELLTLPSGQDRGLRVAKAATQDEELAAAGLQLSRMLLSPVASQLGTKRLLIVSEGALQYVPFAALPAPGTAHRPLVVDHEIVSAPSSSTLAVLRSETSGRKPAAKVLAVLADPVFETNDQRIHTVASTPKPGGESKRLAEQRGLAIVKKAATEIGVMGSGMAIPRLPGTRQEADRILALAPPDARKQALDFEASRKTATSEDLSDYRFIHLATHGFLNSVHPELSGIILTMVDEKGEPQQGFLLAHEIYNLKLPAELVVLSACQTGLGKEIKGEGLVGLTRGFMYAGAARIVVSLWSVDDEATSRLMVDLYTDVLKNGRRPAAALRAAQVKMWKQKKWRAPYYWAAFVLQGEWR